MLDVVGVGTNSVDEVLQLPGEARAVLAGGKVRVSDRQFLCGGQTATVMAACAALGLRSGYLGAFGSDEHGRLIRNALKSVRCRCAGLDRLRCAEPRRGHPRRSARQPHRSLASQRSSEGAVPGRCACPRCRRTSFMSTTMIRSWRCMPRRIARSAGTPVTSDLEHVSDQVEQLIASVTYPIFEQHLPARLTGEPDPERALRKLRRLNHGLLVHDAGESRGRGARGRYVSTWRPRSP